MSASTTRRRSTVHDFSTLRLHSDGTRVQINPPTRAGLHDSRTRDTGRDIRGNRVARDAAGHGVVPKRAVMREDDNDEVHNARPRVPRRRKRGRIDDDQVEFLGASGSGARRHITTSTGGDATTIDANGKGEMMNWPVPSSVRPGPAFFFFSLITRDTSPFVPSVFRNTGLAEMRASLREPVLFGAGSVDRPITRIQT